MPDYFDVWVTDAIRSIHEGYYDTPMEMAVSPASLKESILKCEAAPIISEIKFASPSLGILRENSHVREMAKDMEEGGVVGISVLTEPKHFGGHVGFIAEVRGQVKVPILMKDIIVSPLQVEAASKAGASAVLLIQTLFERGYCQKDVEDMIDYSHSKGLEVLLEVHTEDEFLSALKTGADMIGINNRNLRTLEVNLEVTKRILAKHHVKGKVTVSESGINSPGDIRFLRKCGARAFLVGTAIMKAPNLKEKVKELVESF